MVKVVLDMDEAALSELRAIKARHRATWEELMLYFTEIERRSALLEDQLMKVSERLALEVESLKVRIAALESSRKYVL